MRVLLLICLIQLQSPLTRGSSSLLRVKRKAQSYWGENPPTYPSVPSNEVSPENSIGSLSSEYGYETPSSESDTIAEYSPTGEATNQEQATQVQDTATPADQNNTNPETIPDEGSQSVSEQDEPTSPEEESPTENSTTNTSIPNDSDIYKNDSESNYTTTTKTPTMAPTERKFESTPVPTSAMIEDDDNKWRPYDDEPTYEEQPTDPSWPDYTKPENTTPYQPPDGSDPLDNVNDDDIKQKWENKDPYSMQQVQKKLDDMMHDRNVKIVAIVFGILGFVLLLCVAEQLIENPNGCIAKSCRCVVCVYRVLCWPCRFVCCCTGNSRVKARRTHQQLMTTDDDHYGYTHDLELT